MRRQVAAVIVVRCKGGHTREIGPEGPGPGGFPMCALCYRPMFPVKVKTRAQRAQGILEGREVGER